LIAKGMMVKMGDAIKKNGNKRMEDTKPESIIKIVSAFSAGVPQYSLSRPWSAPIL